MIIYINWSDDSLLQVLQAVDVLFLPVKDPLQQRFNNLIIISCSP